MQYKKIFILFLLISSFSLASAQNVDINLLRGINVSRNTSLDPAFKFLSSTATATSIALPASLLIIGGLSRNKLTFRNGWQTGLTISGSMLISTVLKYSIGRPRPYKTYSDIENLSTDFTPSFPSGHTVSVFSTATTLSLMYPKWYVIVPSYAWASAVAYSRMHLGMHYPFDVLAGIIIGMGTSYLSYRLQNKYKF